MASVAAETRAVALLAPGVGAGHGASASTPVPAPTLRVTPRAARIGDVIRAVGAAPRGAVCPRVRLTVGRPAAGAAWLVRIRALVRRRYAIGFRPPAIPVPSVPARAATTEIVRISCIRAAWRRWVSRTRAVAIGVRQ